MANLLARRRTDPYMPLLGAWMGDLWQRSLPLARTADLPAVERALMDVVDKGDHFEVKLDMPGVRKEDIEVAVEGARVAIRAETRTTKETKEGERVLHTERSVAMYARTFELPAEVTEANAAARYEDGVLTLSLPRRAALASRRLVIS